MSDYCDLCGTWNKEKVEYRLCQRHMNECVIGERDMKAERDTWNKIANKLWHSWLTARKERDEAREFAQKQYDRAEVQERRHYEANYRAEKAEAAKANWQQEALALQSKLADKGLSILAWKGAAKKNRAQKIEWCDQAFSSLLANLKFRRRTKEAETRAAVAEKRVAVLRKELCCYLNLVAHHRDDHHGDD